MGFSSGLGKPWPSFPASRSGGTITVGLPLGYTREAAARVSFLLAIPAVLLSGVFQLVKSSDAGTLAVGPTIVELSSPSSSATWSSSGSSNSSST